MENNFVQVSSKIFKKIGFQFFHQTKFFYMDATIKKTKILELVTSLDLCFYLYLLSTLNGKIWRRKGKLQKNEHSENEKS